MAKAVSVDRSNWVTVTVLEDRKLVVPEWDTFKVRAGQVIKLPPNFVNEHQDWFQLPGKPRPAVSNRHYIKAVLDLKSPKELEDGHKESE